MDEKLKRRLGIGAICTVALLIVGMITAICVTLTAAPDPSETEAEFTQVTDPPAETILAETVPTEVVYVEKETVITANILQDGLNDMGFLITQEYYFTEVISRFDSLSAWDWEIPLTESGYIISYDGTVDAGVDFCGIAVEKDEDERTVTVFLPAAQIRTVSIDRNSFRCISEKESLFTHLSVEDFNADQAELEKNARTKAVERGILTHAEENARSVIRQFVGSLVSSTDYQLLIVRA